MHVDLACSVQGGRTENKTTHTNLRKIKSPRIISRGARHPREFLMREGCQQDTGHLRKHRFSRLSTIIGTELSLNVPR